MKSRTLFIFILITINVNTFSNEKDVLARIKEFSQNLKKELTIGLQKSEVEAIKICAMKAPKIQANKSDSKIQIGRVSLKNRNPNGYPKDWMMEIIQSYHNKKTNDPYKIVKLENGKNGLLKPIPTMPVCLKCHGENISSIVQSKLKEIYPNDKATGYKVGQIRGFFWAVY